jgi:hypothetical protein
MGQMEIGDDDEEEGVEYGQTIAHSGKPTNGQ